LPDLGSPLAKIYFLAIADEELDELRRDHPKAYDDSKAAQVTTSTTTTPRDEADGLFFKDKQTVKKQTVMKKRKASGCEDTVAAVRKKTARIPAGRRNAQRTCCSSRSSRNVTSGTPPRGWPPTGTACELKFDDVWWSGIVTSYPVPLYPGSSTVKIILDEDPGRFCVLYTDVDEGYFRILAPLADR
jgi:hypothetical protein